MTRKDRADVRRLTIVTGPPAGGKSTYVAEHAKPGDVRVDFDALAVALGSDTPHDAPKAIADAARVARAAVVAHVLESACDAWIIHSFATAEQLADYRAAGADVVSVDPGRDVAEQQARADGRPQSTFDGIERYYREQKGANMGTKFFSGRLELKALGEEFSDQTRATFTAYASVFGGEPDSYGDVVERGAFAATLEEWKASGDLIPLWWGHGLHDPFNNIGQVLSAVEDDHGLLVECELDLTNPTAMQVYKLLKARRVCEMSFGYVVRKDERRDGVNHLLDVELLEVSVVPVGANRATDILDVKAALAKAGRVLSAANESLLQEAVDQIQEAADKIEQIISASSASLDASAGEAAPDKTATRDKTAPNDEEPVTVKSAGAVEDQTRKVLPELLALWVAGAAQEHEGIA